MLTTNLTETQALLAPANQNQLPATTNKNDIPLVNATGVTIVLGDLVMLDTASTGVVATGGYSRVIAPTVAGNLAAAGQFHLVCQGTVLANAIGLFRLFGNTKLNLNGSSATIGTKIGTRGTNKDATVTTPTTLTKIIGLTQIATTTGVVNVYFDGRPPGIAIAV